MVNQKLVSHLPQRIIEVVHNWVTDQNSFQVDVSDVLQSVVIDDSDSKVRDVFACITLATYLNDYNICTYKALLVNSGATFHMKSLMATKQSSAVCLSL